MVKGLLLQGAQNLPSDVVQVIDQLERHCLAPDGSLVPKPASYDLQLVLQLSLSLSLVSLVAKKNARKLWRESNVYFICMCPNKVFFASLD